MFLMLAPQQTVGPMQDALSPAYYFLCFNESPYPDCKRKHRGWWLCKRRAWLGNVMMREREKDKGREEESEGTESYLF